MKYSRPILVILAAVFGLIIFNLHSSSFGFLLKPLTDEFGWSRTEIAGVFSLSRLFWIPLIIAAAVVLDWRGGRIVIIAGSLAAALGGYGLSGIASLSQFRIWYFVFSVASALFGGILPFVILANWFVRLRGILIGFALATASIGTLLGPPLVAKLIESIGWRTTYFVLGLLPLVLIPLALFIRRRPEDVETSPDFSLVSNRATLLEGWSALAARRYYPSYDAQNFMAGFRAYSLSFNKNKGTAVGILVGLLFLFITVIAYSSRSGLIVHLVPSIVDAGASVSVAVISLTAIAVTFPIGALVLGVLSDFLHVRLCLAASLLMFGLGTLVVNINPPSILGPCIVGLGQGGLVCLVTIVLADYFGRGVLGILRGFLGVFVVVAEIISPIVIGYIYDTTGSYSTVFIGMGVGLLICAGLAILLWPPNYEKLPIS